MLPIERGKPILLITDIPTIKVNSVGYGRDNTFRIRPRRNRVVVGRGWCLKRFGGSRSPQHRAP